MKARSAALQGALAVAGLIAAYVTWQRPDVDKDADVVVLDLSRSDLQRVRYEDGRRQVELTKDSQGMWIRSVEKPPKPPPAKAAADADGGTVAAVADGHHGAYDPIAAAAGKGSEDAGTSTVGSSSVTPAPAPAPKPREYRANEAAEKLVEKFAPLRGLRALGTLPDEKLKEVGLAESERILEVVTASGTHRFRISNDVVGAGAPYLRSETDGRVYLVRGTMLADLEFATSRLVDRRLHAFREDEFDAVTVQVDGKERTLSRTGDKLGASADGAPDELATNWHEKVWRLMGIDVLGRGETPAAGEPVVQVKIDYRKGTRSVGFIELGQAGSDVFARTEHTAGWVRLHGGAEQILGERSKIVDPQG